MTHRAHCRMASVLSTAALVHVIAAGGAHGQLFWPDTKPGPDFYECPQDCCTAEDKSISDPIMLGRGDYQLRQTDLFIPGRGIDFEFTRTYRSRSGIWTLFGGASVYAQQWIQGVMVMPTSPMGTNWSHSYDIWAKRGGGCGGSPCIIDFLPGNGRCDTYLDGEAKGDLFFGYFKDVVQGDIEWDANNPGWDRVKYITTDHTVYLFLPFNDFGAAAGKVKTITDRNGNVMTFHYDSEDPQFVSPSGRLMRITDTLGRTITFRYHAEYPDILWQVEDFAGRIVTFTHDEVIIERGAAGPNDPGPRLDYIKHNLVKVELPEVKNDPTNGFIVPTEHLQSGRRTWEFEYDAEPTATEAPNYHNDIWWGGSLTTVTSPNGEIIVENEYSAHIDGSDYWDERNYRIMRQRHGRTGGVDNWYEYVLVDRSLSQFDWSQPNAVDVWVRNRAGHVKKIGGGNWITERRDYTHNDGSADIPGNPGFNLPTFPETVPSEFFPQTTPQVRAGDPAYWTKETAYASVGGLPASQIDGLGTEVVSEYDEGNGNPLKRGNLETRTRISPITGDPQLVELWEYNHEFGACGCGSNNATKHTVVMSTGGNQVIDYGFDANGNRTSITHRDVKLAASSGSVQDIVETFTYDSHGRIATNTKPSNGTVSQIVRYEYHQDPQAWGYGYLQSVTDNDTEQDPLKRIVTSFEYDRVGNVTWIVDPNGAVVLHFYNQLGQRIRTEHVFGDHESIDYGAVQQRGYAVDYFYDLNGNLVRIDTQNRIQDPTDPELWIADPVNPVLTTIHEYDELDFRTATFVELGVVSVPLSVRDGSTLAESDFVVTRYAYDANKNLIRIEKGEATGTSPRQPGNVVTFEYDERDMLYRQTIGTGADALVTQYNVDGNGNVVDRILDPDGSSRITTYTYDGFNRVKRIDDSPALTGGDSDFTTYTYDNAGNTLSEKRFAAGTNPEPAAFNRQIVARVMTYDSMNRLLRTEVTSGNGDPMPDAQAPAPVPLTTAGVTETVYHPSSSVWRTFHQWTEGPFSQRMVATDHYYDAAGRIVRVVDAAGAGSGFPAYSAPTAVGNEIRYEYDQASNVTATEEHDFSSVNVSLGRIEQTFRTEYEYDVWDRLMQVTDSAGNTTKFGYDSRGNRVRFEDAKGQETRYEYDALSRSLATIIDMNGNGAARGDAADIVTLQDWDRSSRLIGRRDDNGNWTAYAYDSADRRVGTRMADGTVHQLGSGLTAGAWSTPASPTDYAPFIASWPAPGFTTGINAVGDVVAQIDANGSMITSGYDGKGRLTDRAIAPGMPSIPVPEGGGPLIAPIGGTTAEHYKHDALNRVYFARDDDTLVIRSYDALNRVRVESIYIDPTGDVDEYADDTLAVDGWKKRTFTYTYDNGNNLSATTYPNGRVIDRTYDSLGRVVQIKSRGSVSVPPGSAADVAAYAWMGASRMAVRIYDNGTESLYAYDGRTKVADQSGVLVDPPADPVSDHGAGRLSRITHVRPGDPQAMPPVPDVVLDQRGLLWDQNQNKSQRINERIVGSPRLQHEFGYDASDRLTDTAITDLVASSVTSVEYTIDGVHNRAEVEGGYVQNPFRTIYQMNGADRPVNQYTFTPDSAPLYDDNGNLVKSRYLAPGDINLDGSVNAGDFNILGQNMGLTEAIWGQGDMNGDGLVNALDFTILATNFGGSAPDPDVLEFDYRNQLIKFKKRVDSQGVADETFTYAYDCFGRRVHKTSSVHQTDQWFLYGGAALWQICQVEVADGPRVQGSSYTVDTLVHGAHYIDEIVQVLPDQTAVQTGPYYLHHDDQFSTMAISDASGEVVTRIEYSDYGSPTFMNEAGQQQTLVSFSPLLLASFQGREWDKDIAMHQFRFRWMDPARGRFVTRDPLGTWFDLLSAGSAVIAHGSSPQHRMDPFGLASEPHSVPDGAPLPPGFDPENPGEWRVVPPTEKDPSTRFIDPDGGVRRHHPGDKIHHPHWDVTDPDGGERWEPVNPDDGVFKNPDREREYRKRGYRKNTPKEDGLKWLKKYKDKSRAIRPSMRCLGGVCIGGGLLLLVTDAPAAFAEGTNCRKYIDMAKELSQTCGRPSNEFHNLAKECYLDLSEKEVRLGGAFWEKHEDFLKQLDDVYTPGGCGCGGKP